MIRVIFVCLGNICRSPMAEAVFKRMIEERGVARSFEVSSSATSDCEVGNPVYPPARRVLKAKGYDFTHFARQITLQDVKNADYIFVMDSGNMRDISYISGGQYLDKISKLGSYLPNPMDIDDPWYTGEFERTYSEIYSSCEYLLDFLLNKHKNAIAYDKVF